MAADSRPISFDVAGGALAGQRYGTGPRLALALHGITANSMCWAAIADALPDDWSLVALDLRGRGRSREMPGPFGLRVHAADAVSVARSLAEENGGQLPLVGHSMGAYVAVHAAALAPELFTRQVLVDGGVGLPLPEGLDADEVLAATLGPALERLSVTYPDQDAYVAFFRAHPALADHWNDAVEDYVRYDALAVPGGVRSRAVEGAVREDGRDLLVDAGTFEPEVREAPMPVTVLPAPYGMFGQPGGMLPEAGLAAYATIDHVTITTIPDVNHYTILFDPAAATIVAEAITA